MHLVLGVMLLVLVWLVAAAIRALRQRPLLGVEGMLGSFGIARTDIGPEGQVEAKGTRWQAQTVGPPIVKGSRVRITSVSGLMLIVEPTDVDPN